jgi:hypothetical protein
MMTIHKKSTQLKIKQTNNYNTKNENEFNSNK